ncbi:guanine nucleotide binding protein, alpha subunit [Polychytrium aggregatum]|uniref:guanine nucleotide binding protein, alpha subunit n=1 Tax=Polychytrium aggregatum TaxID=110093 RepID=UPI0022FE2E09|nr:guanine nucleotide binding protein, alpha subunit [Polychytrium aggregatum]KAI9203338.1 guanine nucleotide binding protein, alpha subunit [Polychytrium aggregatum]
MCKNDAANEARARSNQIDKIIKKDKKSEKDTNSIKILLLGSGESGKSTILKQFKLLYGTGFTDTDYVAFRLAALSNLAVCMKILIREANARKLLPREPTTDVRVNAVLALPDIFSETPGEQIVQPETSAAIQSLWKLPAIQEVFALSHEFQLPDCCAYFMDNCARLCDANYKVTEQDALYVRIMTSSISENRFRINDIDYRIYDVGGQRSERKKWMHYFDNVHGVLFVSAVGSYDQVIMEDSQTNRMEESIKVFETVCNHPLMMKIPMLIFYNKIDLLEQKLKDPTKPLKKYFPDFDEPNDMEHAQGYFKKRFIAVNQSPARIMYHYFTQATDTRQIKTILNMVTLSIMQLDMATTGIM